MKRVLWSIALGAVMFMFYACGEGAIEVTNSEDNLALLNYGEFNPDGMQGLVSEAMAECEADPRCKQAMENSEDIPRPANVTSSSSADSSKAPADSSNTPADSTLSSSEAAPASSQEAAESSSTAQPESAATSSETVVSSSSQSKTITPTQFIGSCKASSGVKGFPITWSFEPITYCTLASNCSLVPETYEWTFQGGDIETSTDEKPQVVYASAGTYSASVTVKNGEVTSTFTCESATVVGPDITGCTCGAPTYSPASADIKDAATVTASWEISGCTSVDGLGNEQELTYSWSGTGVTGNGTSGTGAFTEMGDYTATVTVSNDDGKSAKVTCSATVIDNTPFRCNADNSTLLNTEGGENNKAVFPEVWYSAWNNNARIAEANKCYSYPMHKSTRTDEKIWLQLGSWKGVTTMYYADCNGNKGKTENGAYSFKGVDVGYTAGKQCNLYFYLASTNEEFQIMMWPPD